MAKSIPLPDEAIIKKIQHDGDINLVFGYLKELLNPRTEPFRKIGFRHVKED